MLPIALVSICGSSCVAPGGAAATAAANRFLPPAALDLRLAAPVSTWDEALPLGNGLLGGLLWGEDSTLRLSLDRGDLWDVRQPDVVRSEDWNYAAMKRFVATGDQQQLNAVFDRLYGAIKYPTKIPGGRLELSLAPSQTVRSFTLNLATATGHVDLEGGAGVDAFYSATEPVALMRIPGPELQAWRMLPPAAVQKLGYAAAVSGGEGDERYYLQEAAAGLRYGAVAATRRVGDATLLAVTVVSNGDDADPLALGRRRVREALARGYEELHVAHRQWWRSFWERSRVTVPDQHILQHYYLVQYFHGAASRRGAPPMPLQGVWTADAGGLPPWKGDYHHDLNTQTTYCAYQTAGHFDEGAAFLDFMADLLPKFRAFARSFYATGGAAVPGVMAIDGGAMGGWSMYSLSPTNGAWVAFLFYQHWLFTRDDADLARAYEWCGAIGECLRELLVPDGEGVLRLPLSSSPEIHDNSARAWLPPNSNYDNDCLLALFRGLEHMATERGRQADAERWARIWRALPPRLVAADDVLMFSSRDEFRRSHRHHSHAMAIHPFGLLDVEGTDRDRTVIDATLDRFEELGTQAWTGYSFSWFSCMLSRARRAEAAYHYLDTFVRAFVLRNGFHCNGDQTRTGLSGFTYRPFTLEGNFLAAQAVHEMLLQSQGGTVRLFPAMPWRWHDAEFERLRAEGGWIVSAVRQDNHLAWARIEATRAATLRLRDQLDGRVPVFSRAGVTRDGDDWIVAMAKGEVVELTFGDRPEIPPKPADAAEPITFAKTHVSNNRLPLRIGADSNGGSRFVGDIARASVFDRALTAAEVADLAVATAPAPGGLPGCVASWDFADRTDAGFPSHGTTGSVMAIEGEVVGVDAGGYMPGKALRLDGGGFISTPHCKALDCRGGVTLEAWIRPAKLPAAGARILDKTPVGGASAYMLDTYPGNSLRLVFRDPHLRHDARLVPGQWAHVAATIDGETGAARLYLNGVVVAERSND
ncbi:MAG: glycoside hydrolase N-terminal domain-containing protein [Planctomycetes bacterium]|nr:glycoside hydrolase N-terminal domain-containing protein [Planctomycetota bacterium]